MTTNVLIVLGFAAVAGLCLIGVIGFAAYSMRVLVPENTPEGDA